MKIKEIVFEAKRIPRKKGQKANSKKHSDLYTDENPKGTIHGLGFKDEATARSSVAKIRKSGRSHAHKIQAAVAMEQRAKAAGKAGPASIYRKYINSMKKKTKAKNEAAGVGIVTKQNATKDVPVGGEYMNVKKLGLGKGKPKKIKESVGDVNLATGEACGGRIMFKQFFETKAIDICQIDSCRLGSINEILTVLLMAHKLKIPVFPHAGGVGLCE